MLVDIKFVENLAVAINNYFRFKISRDIFCREKTTFRFSEEFAVAK